MKCDGCGKPFDENGGICEPCHSASISGHIKPLGNRIRELEAERDAIRAKTIEDVAKYWEAQDCWDIASEIRALVQTDEG